MTSLGLDGDVSSEPPLSAPRESRAFLAAAHALRHAWRVGGLTVVGPAGTQVRCEGPTPGYDGRMEVRDLRFLRRLLLRGDIGFADAYVAGEWDTPDLAACLTTFAANFDALDTMMNGSPAMRLLQALSHGMNRNSRSGSRRNIAAHYDLGDDFYRLWLDEGMNYSSALALPPGADLAAAQRAKHAALARTMDLKQGQSLLEIGCGWGGFALYAAREHGARVTAVTVSRRQHDYAAREAQAAGLSDRVDVQLRDYRDIEGRFDRVASIEMFEAVGERYWPAFFSVLRRSLVDGGRAGLQVITIDERLFEGYRRRPDFIQLHVFPGGMLPTEKRLKEEAARAGLPATGIGRYGQGYADTLKDWGRRYREHAAEVAALGFDRQFDRLWRYYLAYCEAGFRNGRTDVVQLGLARG